MQGQPSVNNVDNVYSDTTPTYANENVLNLLSTETYDIPTAQKLKNLLTSGLPVSQLVKAAYREGTILFDNDDDIPIKKVLFDTGAVHANYISEEFVRHHRGTLTPFITDYKSSTYLGDGKTQIQITNAVILHVQFTDDCDNEYTAQLPFCIMQMTSNNMILGLPSIVKHFAPLLMSMIYSAQHQELNNISDGLIEPWADPTPDIAPEDDQTPLPCSFSTVLYFMELGLEEAVKEYLSLIPLQVCEDFIKGSKKDVVKLLSTLGVKVFVPSNWDGISGIEPIDLEVLPDMPKEHRPKSRPINPKLFEHAKTEIIRLKGYMYRDSTSPIASPIVVAPKATQPFIRICGDYTWLNPYLLSLNYPIPHVPHQLDKICKFKIFIDLDMTNSFHQIRVTLRTSMLLSVVTPLGQLEPMFLPEGIPPASQILQRTVMSVFEDFQEWMIVIFDNFLILAHDYDDAYDKLELVLKRCIARNLVLKFKKSFLGFTHANFFGYECRQGNYGLSDKRKIAIKNIPFPTKQKEMMSFLGAANFFSSHVPKYTDLTAPLYEMVRKDFDWNKVTWKLDYEALFEFFKIKLQEACAIFYPDYELEWVLRTDASIVGVSAALFQLLVTEANTEWQPIGLASHKFSDAATRWTTIEQEAFGCYFGILSFEYKLRGKRFVLETDHRNLIWMEKSVVPKIVRWVTYMKSFTFAVRHVPGKLNNVADHLSRYFVNNLYDTLLCYFPSMSFQSIPLDTMLLHAISLPTFDLQPLEEGGVPDVSHSSSIPAETSKVLSEVHNARQGHWGVRHTMKTLDQEYPGHKIPSRLVAEYIAQCPICQKNRQDMIDSIHPVVRHLKPEHKRKTIGIDTLELTPPDIYGNQYLIVIVVHYTKLAWGYPSKTKDAETLATAIVTFFSLYGLFDTIMTDPGADLMSNVIKKLNEYYGIKHVVSLVDRHESNGVEGTNKQILRHLRALLQEERIVNQWSAPSVLPLIFYLINSHCSSETGITPFEAHFGSDDSTYMQMPKGNSDGENTHEFVRLLDQNLKILDKKSREYQQAIIAKRRNTQVEQNIYQPGDFVLFLPDHRPPNSKLSPKYIGPYIVINQIKNDVQARHLSSGAVHVLHVERLKRFYGTTEQAKEAANIDYDQHEVTCITGYRGDINQRKSMQFEIQFNAGDKIWKYFCKDIYETTYFEEYCRQHPELKPLLQTKQASEKYMRELNKQPIEEFHPGDTAYVNLRYVGYEKYMQFNLPNHEYMTYLMEIKYGALFNNGCDIEVTITLPKKRIKVKHQWVELYGCYKQVNTHMNMVLIDAEFIQTHPEVKIKL